MKSSTTAKSKAKGMLQHLHIVVDDTLHNKLTLRAQKAGQNLSAVARDILRAGLGLPPVVIR